MLPDGIAREDLTELLPDGALAAATVLRQFGLAFGEADRLRTLAPIREHVAASYPPDPVDLDRAVDHYARLAVTGGQVGRSDGARTAARLQADTGNIAALLECAAARHRTAELSDAVTGLAEYWRFTGLVQPALAAIAEQAIETHGTPSQQAATWLALANLARDRSDLDTAQAQYERAQTLFQQIGDVLGEAKCVQGLGDIARDRSELDTARARYEQALPMHQQAGDAVGEAHCIRSLGDIDLERSNLDAAQTRYEQALPMFQQAGSVLGEALCIQGLGDIAQDRKELDTARARYEQALPMHQQIGDVLGEANCIQGLGDVAREQCDNDEARTLYDQALALYQAVRDPHSAGWTLVGLARLDSAGGERARHWQAAREAWASIGRDDLIESVRAEFE
jgi:tetratricopeptide (TPR) repeat protein